MVRKSQLYGTVGLLALLSLGAACGPDRAAPDPEGDPFPIIVIENRLGAEFLADAQEQLAAREYEQVLQIADGVIGQLPESGLAYEVRGAALLGLNRVVEAAAALRRATQVESGQSGPWTKLGVIQMEAGDIEGALVSLDRAIGINDRDRYAHQRLGLLYEYRNDVPNAIFHLGRGLEGTPSDYLGVAVNLARMQSLAGRHQEAVATLEPRLGSGNGDAIAHLVLASSYYGMREYGLAASRYERAIELDPDLDEARVGLAMSEREGGDPAAALRILETILAGRPDWTVARIEAGKTLLEMGREEEAARAFGEFVDSGGSPALVSLAMAEFYLDNSEPNRALGAYEAMIASGTAGPEVYARASELLLAGDRADDGERMLRDALARFPRTAYAHMRLGSYLAALTRYQEAIPVLERAAELAPGDPLVQRSLSLARVRTGDEVGARAAAQRFYELAPGPDSGVLYASRLEAGGQRDAAVAIYREVLRAAPDSALALNNLAFMLAGENEGEDEDALEEAGTMARRATSLAPTNGNVWDTLGWILHLQGDDAGAAEALDRAISLGPATASVHYHRGVVLHSTGRAAEAQEALREALTREPGASWSRDAEARLEDMR